MTIQWKEVTADKLDDLAKVLKLYDQTFPLEVREDHQILQQGLQYAKDSFPNKFHLLTGLKDEEVVSFAVGHYLAAANAGFLVYLAANPAVRSKGIGTKTLLKFEEIVQQDALVAGHKNLRAIVLETEKEELVHTELEKRECQQRKKFYDRNSYYPYERIEYLQPDLHGDSKNIPLNILVKSFENEDITLKEIKTIIKAIYQEKYHKVNRIEQKVLENCLNQMEID